MYSITNGNRPTHNSTLAFCINPFVSYMWACTWDTRNMFEHIRISWVLFIRRLAWPRSNGLFELCIAVKTRRRQQEDGRASIFIFLRESRSLIDDLGISARSLIERKSFAFSNILNGCELKRADCILDYALLDHNRGWSKSPLVQRYYFFD